MSEAMLAVLKKHFGFAAFRAQQSEVIEACLAGRDTLVVLPMASGKSLCYAMPALLRARCMVVVSPLLSLIEDQLLRFQAQGVAAAQVEGGSNGDAVVDDVLAGRLHLLYVTPEKLANWSAHLTRLGNAGALCGVAVDEAHCISTWGHDFRPAYQALRNVKTLLPQLPVMALTATATPRVRDDIVHTLGLRNCFVALASFDRPNLTFLTCHKAKKAGYEALVAAIEKHAGEQAQVIVYGRTVAAVNEITGSLTFAASAAAAAAAASAATVGLSPCMQPSCSATACALMRITHRWTLMPACAFSARLRRARSKSLWPPSRMAWA